MIFIELKFWERQSTRIIQMSSKEETAQFKKLLKDEKRDNQPEQSELKAVDGAVESQMRDVDAIFSEKTID